MRKAFLPREASSDSDTDHPNLMSISFPKQAKAIEMSIDRLITRRRWLPYYLWVKPGVCVNFKEVVLVIHHGCSLSCIAVIIYQPVFESYSSSVLVQLCLTCKALIVDAEISLCLLNFVSTLWQISFPSLPFGVRVYCISKVGLISHLINLL